jgi:hypothetical protein
MEPTVGRIVHYVSYGTPGGEYGKECRAAVGTGTHGRAMDPTTGRPVDLDLWVADLCVLNPTGMFFNQGVVQMEIAHDGGTWHWPERVS